jgi:hypothetical protein
MHVYVVRYHGSSLLEDVMNGILNETTNTVHRHDPGTSRFETECGLTHHVAPDHLRRMPIEQAISKDSTSKCGRCFPEAGGY